MCRAFCSRVAHPRHLDQLGRRMRLVTIGPLADEIDIAGDDLLPSCRCCASAPRAAPGAGRKPSASACIRTRAPELPGAQAVHLVDEQHMGDAAIVEELEQRRQHLRLVRRPPRRRRSPHRRSSARSGPPGTQLHRTRTIEEGPALAQDIRRWRPDLDAHLAGPGFGRAVAYGIPVARPEPLRPTALAAKNRLSIRSSCR